MNLRPILAVAALAFATPAAYASCAWEWMCNGEGSCKQMPVCDSVYEVPPPRPNEAAPTPPPMSIRPHQSPRDMRGLDCEEIMRRSPGGHWSWDQACFCADPMKARDPTTPFANIVRCQAPWKDDMKTSSPGAPAKGAAARSAPT